MSRFLFCVALTAVSFQISLGAALPWLQYPLLEKLLLGDLLVPPLALYCLHRYGGSGLPRFYASVAGLLLLTHLTRQDAPYWLGQILHGLTYYVFLVASRSFGYKAVARSIVYCWTFSLPLFLLYGFFFQVDMGRHMGEYSTMSLLLTERFQFLAGNPNKLVAFHLFLALCFALGWRGQALSRQAVFGLILLCATTLFTKSRDVPLVGLLCLSSLYPCARRSSFLLLAGACVAVSCLGTLAIYRSVLPLEGSFPYLNLRHPSSYWARSQYPYVRMLGDATPLQLLCGRGYGGLATPYHQFKRAEMIKDALSTYDNGPSVEEHPWLYVHSPPHNSALLILNAGGFLWAAGLLFLLFVPWGEKGPRKSLSWVFLACLLVESLSHDSVHYPWPFAGIALLHAYENEAEGPG